MSTPDTDELLDCAIDAARTAAGHALANAGRRTEIAQSFSHDVKLKLDIECQHEAESVIRKRFPDHPILGEESGSTDNTEINGNPGESEFLWIIDPIDGTVNFSHGLPLWCCSVAVRRQDTVVAGAVYAPELDNLYSASINRKAMLNGSEIAVSKVRNLSDSIVMTGMDKEITPDVPPFEIFQRIALNTQKARIMGSAALDICHVACGKADGYFESGIYIWDIAAAGLVVRQAGGKTAMTDPEKETWRLSFVASNGHIHSELRNLVGMRE
jgi:myo-inositol-1(or 4)-monophosphatase